MKRILSMTIAALLLAGASFASAQSVADIARSARKGKTPSASTHHYDNDNLPTTDHLSVVGPPPPAANGASTSDPNTSAAPAAPAVDPKTVAADRQRAADEMKTKIDAQKKTI